MPAAFPTVARYDPMGRLVRADYRVKNPVLPDDSDCGTAVAFATQDVTRCVLRK